MRTRHFELPDLGEGLTEGTIVEWVVDVGDTVAVDDVVARVETAKALVDVPCPFAGEVEALHVEPGSEVEVGEPILAIATTEDAGESGSGSVLVGFGTGGERKSRRRRGASAEPSPSPGGDGGASASSSANGHPPSDPSGRPLAKPPVRKLAKDLGVDLGKVEPSGPDGVITREDVHAASTSSVDTQGGEADREGVERIAVSGVRKRIAEQVTRSRLEIPEAASWVDCDVTETMRLREELNATQEEVRVSPLAIILRVVVEGLRRYPELNSSFDAEAGEIHRHRRIHLGVAAQTERGLLVPVLRDAEQRTILQLAEDLQRTAERAREGNLEPGELTGSTFSVSNFGSFGVDGGSPVINHPNGAILGVGRIAERPWVVDGELSVRSVCQLSLVFDHRICDGAEAGGFLRFVGDCLERPALLLGSL